MQNTQSLTTIGRLPWPVLMAVGCAVLEGFGLVTHEMAAPVGVTQRSVNTQNSSTGFPGLLTLPPRQTHGGSACDNHWTPCSGQQVTWSLLSR